MLSIRQVVGFFIVLALCAACDTSQESKTEVVILGTGSPVPDPNRSGPALAIVVNGKSYLVDAGVGCVREAVKAYQDEGIEALSASNLKILFLTHLHSDHTLGYPDLMLTPWDRRDKPLAVYGPKGTQWMTDKILEAYAEDIKVRIEGLQEVDAATLTPDVHEISPGEIYKDSNVTVTAFSVKHGTFPHCFGFKFVTPDKTIVISGDTSPTNIVPEEAHNADILIHEVYSMKKYDKASPEMKKYLKAFHTSTQELAEIAQIAQPKLLVPIHMLGIKGMPEGTIEKEIREAGYEGEISETHDLSIF